MRSEAQKKADRKFKAANTKCFNFEFNKNTDADIIEFLSKQENKLGLLKRLLREEMKKED